jgi:hypothetical protein
MAQLLKAGPEQMARLFSGKQVVLKKTHDKAIAIKYGTALKKVGADVKLRAIQVADAPVNAATPVAAPQGKVINTNFELLPNEGNIFDPAPRIPAPEIPGSNLELAEVGADILVNVHEEIHLEVDLSSFTLAEPGSDLVVEDRPEVPKVTPPDFSLDEPGAVLETHHEEVEKVHPDISGITLAPTGSDLLTEEEKSHKVEPPPAPDTSRLQLVSGD